MKQSDYYKAPPQKVFDEIKKASIEIWQSYDNEFGYADEKVGRIKDIENVSDNAWYMVAMFDPANRIKLRSMVSGETESMILDALS